MLLQQESGGDAGTRILRVAKEASMQRMCVNLVLMLVVSCFACVVGCSFEFFGQLPPTPATRSIGVVAASEEEDPLVEASVWIQFAAPENLQDVVEGCLEAACGTSLGRTDGLGYVEEEVSGMQKIQFGVGLVDVFTPEFWVFRVSTEQQVEVLVVGEELDGCTPERGSFCRRYSTFDGESAQGDSFRLTIDLPL
jgi:hypothetical protein